MAAEAAQRRLAAKRILLAKQVLTSRPETVEAFGVLVGSEVIEANTVAEGICLCAAKLLFRRAMMHVREVEHPNMASRNML